MKKTVGVLAVLGGVAAIVAYKVRKNKKVVKETDITEEDMSEKILRTAQEQNFKEEIDMPASSKSVTYPNLNEEDILYLNTLCETEFTKLDHDSDGRKERPLQHVIQFTNEQDLEAYKKLVINDGYVVTSGNNDYELIVLNITQVVADEILSRVFHLANLAKEYKGKYVNWVLK